MDALALWHTSNTHSEIRSEKLEPLKAGQALVKTRYSLVSIGTERIVSKGQVPILMNERMKVPYMMGSFGFPVKYGYSCVGEIISGEGVASGSLVHVMHPHQNYFVSHIKDLNFLPLEVPLRRALLFSNIETALNVIWDVQPLPGYKVLVIGFGLIGSLIALILRKYPLLTVDIAEIQSCRIDQAKKMGFNVLAENNCKASDYEAAINTSGSGNGLQMGIDALKQGGTLTEVSWYGDKQVQLSLGNSFHTNNIKIKSSQVSNLSQNAFHLWNAKDRKKWVFELLKDDEFDMLFEQSVPFDEAPATFEKLRKNDSISSVIYFTYK